jgi:gliding motility-associated-like protein
MIKRRKLNSFFLLFFATFLTVYGIARGKLFERGFSFFNSIEIIDEEVKIDDDEEVFLEFNSCEFPGLPPISYATNCVKFSHPNGGRFKVQLGAVGGQARFENSIYYRRVQVLDEQTGDYYYEWVELPKYESKLDTGAELAPGYYKVLFFIKGCPPYEHPFTVMSSEPLPDISTQVINHQNTCGTVDGEVRVNVGPITDIQRQQFGNHTFTVTIYEGIGTSGSIYTSFPVSPNNPYNVPNLPAGTYTVTIRNDNNGCVNDAVIFTIEDRTSPPVITLVNSRNSTACEPANGLLEIQVSTPPPGVEPANGYTINWSNGGTGTTLSGIRGGTYTVTVRNNNTNCEAIASYSITESITYPVVSAPTIVHPTNCTNFNSSVAFTLGANQSIAWYNGNFVDEANRISGTETTKTGLAPGNYTVEVRNNLGCGTPYSFTIEDRSTPPAISVVFTPNTACLAASYNGTATATSTGSTNPTFEWYRGTEIDANNRIGTASTNSINGLAPNLTYMVVVRDGATGCTNSTTVTITNAPEIPAAPTVTPQGVTFCSSSNGIGANGSATITNHQNGLTYEWSTGATGTATSLSALSVGTYSVVAINNLGCRSTPANFTIEDNRSLLQINVVQVQPNTQCVAPFNGELRAAVVGGSGNFTYEWFANSTATGTPIAGQSATNITGQEGGRMYTVRITDQTTGCTGVASLNLQNAPVRPAVPILTLVNNTFCDSQNNGSATVTNTANGITYRWSNTSTNTSDSNSGLVPGSYSVVAINTQTGCESDPAYFTIADHPLYPELSVVVDPNTQCSPLTGEINLTVTHAEAGITYTQEWFSGSNTSGTPISEPTGLAGNAYYTVRVNNERGCETIRTFFVPNAIPTVAAPTVTPVNQTNCLASGNGGATVNSPGSLNYRWFNSSGISAGPDGPSIDGLIAGNYSVRAFDPSTGCLSEPSPFTINHAPVIPAVQITASLPDASCIGIPMGQLTVTTTDGSNINDYTFSWAQVTSGGIQPISGTESVRSGLAAGTYRVTVTGASGCSFTLNETISTATPTVPTLTLNSSNFNNCIDFEGSLVEVIMADDGRSIFPDDFTFEWYEGFYEGDNVDYSRRIPNQSGPRLVEFPGGSYTVIAISTLSGCTSAPRSATIGLIPTLQINPKETTFTSCDNNENSAEVEVRVAGALVADFSNFQFTWYLGNPPLINDNVISDSNSPFKDGLITGWYTVEVVDLTTGCSASTTFQIEPVDPIEVLASTNSTSTCDGSSGGEAFVTRIVAEDGVTVLYDINSTPLAPNVEIFWFSGSSVKVDINTDPPTYSPDATGLGFSNLEAGEYTVIVFNRNNIATENCPSVPVTVTVSVPDPPSFTVDPEVHNTSCGNATGSASVNYTGNYSFEWFTGRGNELTQIQGENSHVLNERDAGYYTVIITDNDTQCTNSHTFLIEDRQPEILITANNPDPLLTCTDSNGDPLTGSFTIDALTYAGSTTTIFSDFTFDWYSVDGNGLGSLIISNNSNTISGLQSGTYFVVVSDQNTCESAPYVFTIEDQTTPPAIFYSNIIPDDSCPEDPTVGPWRGSITLTFLTGSTNNGSYNFISRGGWSVGGTVTESWSGGNSVVISGLAAGTYTFEVVDGTTGCSEEGSFTIVQQEQNIFIVEYSSSDTETCFANTGTGSIEIQKIMYEGLEVESPFTGYEFRWFNNENDAIALLNPIQRNGSTLTGPILDELAEGSYFVRVFNQSTNCFSVGLEVNINNIATGPTLELSNVLPNINCTETGTGSAFAVANPNGNNLLNFTFEWRDSNGNILMDFPNGIRITAGVENGRRSSFIEGLEDGEYTVTIIDDLTGCQGIPLEFEIEHQPLEFSITSFDTEPQSECNPENGSITITAVSDNNQIIAAANFGTSYTFEWFDSYDYANPATNNPVSGFIGNTYSPLTAGSYFVRVLNSETGCFSDLIEIVVPEVLKLNTIAFFDANPNRNCDESTYTGSVSARALTGGIGNYNFTFSWRDAVGNTVPSSITGNVSTISTVPGGIYTVTVLNEDTGCPEFEDSFTIIDEPFALSITQISPGTQTRCDYPNGGITVNQILYDGVLLEAPFTNFTFIWSHDNTITGNFVDELSTGSYTVTVRNDITGCLSQPVEIFVPEEITPTLLSVGNGVPNTNCSGPGTGALTAIASSDLPGSVFTFQWIDPQGNPVPANQITRTGNSERATGLVSGEYTIIVTNSLNGCPVTRTYNIVEQVVRPIIMALNAVNLTDCTPNGSIRITQVWEGIANANVNSYLFTWYYGEDNYNNGINIENQSGPFRENLDAGIYYIVARNNSTGCLSDPFIQELRDRSQDPIITFEILSKQRTCDSNIAPTGSLQAFADGSTDINRYNFTWYYGERPIISGNIILGIGNTATISNMPSGYYSVEVLDRVTNCISVGTHYIPDNFELDFDIEAEYNTNCVNYNGRMEVIFKIGTPSDYLVEWFNGFSLNQSDLFSLNRIVENLAPGEYTLRVFSNLTGCTEVLEIDFEDNSEEIPPLLLVDKGPATHCLGPDGFAIVELSDEAILLDGEEIIIEWYLNNELVATGFEIKNVFGGEYTVIAKNSQTLCESEPLIIIIEEDYKFPDFIIEVKNSECGLENGEALVRLVEGIEIRIMLVEWSTPKGSAQGEKIVGYPEGDYEVTVYLENGCPLTKQFRIEEDIYIYKGVSPNGDGLNEHMHIECIELFPENNVKIYNRAGALVYETNGYNNSLNHFLGIGNRGLYAGKKTLPPGTYFYVVDKKDGKKPKAGFIELNK